MTPDETYWQYCADGELRLQHCQTCGSWQFPPSARCRKCLSTALVWDAVSGEGVVWSWLRMHRKYFADPAFSPPYVVVMIELAEGPHLISSIATPDGRDPVVGEPVRLIFDEGTDSNGHRLPRFAALEAEAAR